MTIAGISKIRYAQNVSLTPNGNGAYTLGNEVFTEICDVGSTGQATNDRTRQNGSPLYDSTLVFSTQTDPKDWRNAKAWLYTDRDGQNWIVGFGDEDDYPVVTWQQVNSKSEVPNYQVTVSLKSRKGVLHVI